MYSEFQDSNPERFNKNVLKLRNTENIEDIFNDVFSSLGLEGIEYLGGELIKDEEKQAEILPHKNIKLEDSRLDLFTAKFRLTWKEDVEEVSLPLYFPKLIDDYFFKLNGNTFYAIYQLTDRNFYPLENEVFLKTLLMPLGIEYSNMDINTQSGKVIQGRKYLLNFFKSRGSKIDLKNILYYFFIEYGVEGTIDKIFHNEYEGLVFLEDEENEYENHECVQLRKDLFLYFYYSDTITLEYKSLVATLVDSLSGIRRKTSIYEENFWKKRILKSTANPARADKAIISLKRILDERTKKNLKEVPDEFKEDTFGVLTWMMYNISSLEHIDTTDLKNRRLRLFEYMLFPLLNRLSESSYRILNSRNMDIKRLQRVFSAIRPTYILRCLGTNDLLRYYNATSTLDLYSVALRWSARGPQSLGGGRASVPLQYRSVHRSFIGGLGLNTSSASDPGMTGTLCPMTDKLEDDSMFFKNDDVYLNALEVETSK